jgi:hypothetical protein
MTLSLNGLILFSEIYLLGILIAEIFKFATPKENTLKIFRNIVIPVRF